MTEDAAFERKSTLDLDQPKDRVRLVKEIAAMANSGGGVIVIGAEDDGTEVGIHEDLAKQLDPARIGDLLDRFLRPDRLEVKLRDRVLPNGKVVVEVVVPPVADPPLVLCRPGNYEQDGKQDVLFPAQAVFVRRNTRAEPARREDYRQWRHEAIERARAEIIERLAMVVEAPSDARVRVVSGEDVKDEPSFLLSRSAEIFESRPERLLSGPDLLYLWRHRDTLRFDPVAAELVIQSALRKRATLFLWLAHLQPSADEVKRYIDRAMQMSDRDKSDAGKAILLVGALYLTDHEYDELVAIMGESRYAHMREAAHQLPTKNDGEAHLDRLTFESVDGKPVREYTSDELLGLVDIILSDASSRIASRQLPVIGFEYLRRKHEG